MLLKRSRRWSYFLTWLLWNISRRGNVLFPHNGLCPERSSDSLRLSFPGRRECAPITNCINLDIIHNQRGQKTPCNKLRHSVIFLIGLHYLSPFQISTTKVTRLRSAALTSQGVFSECHYLTGKNQFRASFLSITIHFSPYCFYVATRGGW